MLVECRDEKINNITQLCHVWRRFSIPIQPEICNIFSKTVHSQLNVHLILMSVGIMQENQTPCESETVVKDNLENIMLICSGFFILS